MDGIEMACGCSFTDHRFAPNETSWKQYMPILKVARDANLKIQLFVQREFLPTALLDPQPFVSSTRGLDETATIRRRHCH